MISKLMLYQVGMGQKDSYVGGYVESPYFERQERTREDRADHAAEEPEDSQEDLSIATGGRITQTILKDPFGSGWWNMENCARFRIHLVSRELCENIIGQPLPPSPVDEQVYKAANIKFPRHLPAIESSSALSNVKPLH